MICCDRCKDKARYNTVVGGQNCDLCSKCYSAYEDIQETFIKIERDFLKMKINNIKHIDFD